MTENNYRRISSDTNKQVESHHEWTVKMTENLLPGKKAKGKFLMLNDNYHDWAAQSTDTSPPMDLMDDEIVIVDHNDSTCALKDEILKVTYNSMVGGFVPVGSSGLVRQAIAYGPIPYDDSGEVHLARCGGEISPTIVLEAHNCHSDSGAEIEAESKIVIVYIQGSTDNTIYREGAWHVLVDNDESENFLTFQAPLGGIPASGTMSGLDEFAYATCKILNVNSTGGYSDSGSTTTIYNQNRHRSFLGRNTEQPYDRVGIARKIGSIWVAEPNDEINMVYSQDAGATAFNPAVNAAWEARFSKVRNGTFLRFDDSSVGGLKQDVATGLRVIWAMRILVEFTTTADCHLDCVAHFVFGGTWADNVNMSICKAVSTNSGLKQTFQIASHFIHSVTTSSNLQPSLQVTIPAGVARGSMTLTIQQGCFTGFVLPNYEEEITGLSVGGGAVGAGEE